MSRTTQVMLAVLMLVMMTTKAWSQKTMVVLSDTHVMGPGLLVSEGEAWESYLDNDRKLVDYSRQIFDEQIEDLKAMAPDKGSRGQSDPL